LLFPKAQGTLAAIAADARVREQRRTWIDDRRFNAARAGHCERAGHLRTFYACHPGSLTLCSHIARRSARRCIPLPARTKLKQAGSRACRAHSFFHALAGRGSRHGVRTQKSAVLLYHHLARDAGHGRRLLDRRIRHVAARWRAHVTTCSLLHKRRGERARRGGRRRACRSLQLSAAVNGMGCALAMDTARDQRLLLGKPPVLHLFPACAAMSRRCVKRTVPPTKALAPRSRARAVCCHLRSRRTRSGVCDCAAYRGQPHHSTTPAVPRFLLSGADRFYPRTRHYGAGVS